MTVRNSCAARIPDSSRIVVPELPASSGPAGGGQASGAAAVDLDDLAVAGAFRRPADRHAERPQASEGREAVRPGQVAADVRAAVGERRQHGITVRDGLVAGDSEAAGHSCRRLHQGRVGWRVRHFRTITLASGTHPPKPCGLGRRSPKICRPRQRNGWSLSRRYGDLEDPIPIPDGIRFRIRHSRALPDLSRRRRPHRPLPRPDLSAPVLAAPAC